MLPFGAWANGRNIRFKDGYLEPIREPVLALATPDGALWQQLYTDDTGPRVVIATDTRLFRLDLPGTAWDDVSPGLLDYTPGGIWHSFPWGNAVVFNNGINTPQILLDGATEFSDLPNWGLLSNSGQTVTVAGVLRPIGDRMVALDFTSDEHTARARDSVLADRALIATVVQTREGLEVELQAGVESNELLARLLQAELCVRKFELVEPTLHQIFVDRVGAESQSFKDKQSG